MRGFRRPLSHAPNDRGTPELSKLFHCFTLVEASSAHLHNATVESVVLRGPVEAVNIGSLTLQKVYDNSTLIDLFWEKG